MRIALLVGSTLYPLAGEDGVSERIHSSAGEFRISAQAEKQLLQRVRAETAGMVDRGNLSTTIQFSTSRLFATAAAAFLYVLDHDSVIPRAGTLVMEVPDPTGEIFRRHLMAVVISPPDRRVVGCTALLTYSATGSEIVFAAGTPPPGTPTGNMIVSGMLPITANGVYVSYAMQSGKKSYDIAGAHMAWYTTSGGFWGISPSPVTGGFSARSASNVATPDLATGWYRADTLAAVPSVSVIAEVT